MYAIVFHDNSTPIPTSRIQATFGCAENAMASLADFPFPATSGTGFGFLQVMEVSFHIPDGSDAWAVAEEFARPEATAREMFAELPTDEQSGHTLETLHYGLAESEGWRVWLESTPSPELEIVYRALAKERLCVATRLMSDGTTRQYLCVALKSQIS